MDEFVREEAMPGLWAARVNSGLNPWGRLCAVLELVVPAWEGQVEGDDPDEAPSRLIHMEPAQAFALAVQLGVLSSRQLAAEGHDGEAA